MNYSKIILASLCAAALTSCGGQGALTGPGGQANAAQMGQALTQINNSLGSFAFDATPTVPNVGGAGGQTVTPSAVGVRMMGAFDSCITETPDPTVDADADGIAKTKTYNYNCNNIGDSGYTYNIGGKVNITDLDDTKKYMLGGYRFDMETTFSSKGPGGYAGDWADRGYFEFKKVGSAYVYDSDFRSAGSGVEHGDTYEVTYQGTWKHKVTPDSTATNVWDKGSIDFEGFFELKGTFGSGLPLFGVVFEMNSDSLKYDYTGACTTYQSGSITFADGSGNKTVVTYACTSASATYNGTAITIYQLQTSRERGHKTRLGSLF